MTAEPLTVLYVHNASTVGGGNKVLLGLFDHIDRQRFLPISILPAPGPMESELAARHVSFHVVSQDRTLATQSRVEAVRCTLEFVCVVMKARPALLHANGVLSYRYASLACRLSRARRICHIHHPGEVQSAAWALRVRPHAIVTVSSVMFAEVSEHVSRLSRPPSVIQITNAVDTAAFVPCPNQVALREQTELSRFSFLVIIVGSVTEHKGHRLFLEMARRLLEIEPRAGFLVVGRGLQSQRGVPPGNGEPDCGAGYLIKRCLLRLC